MHNFGKLFLMSLLGFVLSGCLLMPIFTVARDNGATEAGRKDLLTRAQRSMYNSLVTARPREALVHVAPEFRHQYGLEITAREGKEKVTGVEIRSLEPLDDYRKVIATVEEQYYRIPQYMVRKRSFVETWEFALGDGWLLKSRVGTK